MNMQFDDHAFFLAAGHRLEINLRKIYCALVLVVVAVCLYPIISILCKLKSQHYFFYKLTIYVGVHSRENAAPI